METASMGQNSSTLFCLMEDFMLNGIYPLYKGEQKICDISFQNGRVLNVYADSADALPPFYTVLSEKVSNFKEIATESDLSKSRKVSSEKEKKWLLAARMKQFLNSRVLPTTNRYHNLAKEFQFEQYVSFLDNYYLKTEESFDYKQMFLSYHLEEDPFAKRVLWQDWEAAGPSPNLSLPFSSLSFFQLQDKQRYLLQEYSKELADKKKLHQIPYTIEIVQDIPFIKTKLLKGNYFPLSMVFDQRLTEAQQKALCGSLDPSFQLDESTSPWEDLFLCRKENDLRLAYL